MFEVIMLLIVVCMAFFVQTSARYLEYEAQGVQTKAKKELIKLTLIVLTIAVMIYVNFKIAYNAY